MKKILIDTNILISAAYSRKGLPRQAFDKAVSSSLYRCLICEQTLEEFWRIANRKFPERIGDFESFMAQALLLMEVISVSADAYDAEKEIRDIKDRPILRAAISASVDILLTGDKDFIESTIENPKIMKAAEFVTPRKQNES
ncbi:MAG: putative toxin-antitoxin system toxin component, PIN family [Clostridiales Family XIII bacterium]|jgi:putative PIN family toxin of toxin-antitoxin system|nr:putative toxin-antitoxin system toxin component, PIN family [Clostridiales Family XIII bacterium]